MWFAAGEREVFSFPKTPEFAIESVNAQVWPAPSGVSGSGRECVAVLQATADFRRQYSIRPIARKDPID